MNNNAADIVTAFLFHTVMANVDHIMAAREALPAVTSRLRWHLAGETSRRDDFLSTARALRTGTWSSKSKNGQRARPSKPT